MIHDPTANMADTDSQRLAHQIRNELAALGVAASVDYDLDAEGWAVVVGSNKRTQTALIMAAPGALFAVFRGANWLTGTGCRRGEATPAQVAARFHAALTR